METETYSSTPGPAPKRQQPSLGTSTVVKMSKACYAATGSLQAPVKWMKLLKDFTHLFQNAWVSVIAAQVEDIVVPELVVGFQLLAHGVLRISFAASAQSQHGHQDQALNHQTLHHTMATSRVSKVFMTSCNSISSRFSQNRSENPSASVHTWFQAGVGLQQWAFARRDRPIP